MKSEFRTYGFAVQFARECRKLRLPKDLQNQLNRASSSIALNLREGSARHTIRDRHRFYIQALGSFRECEAVFDISEVDHQVPTDLCKMLGGSLNKLCSATKPT